MCQHCKSISHRFEKDKKFSWCLELFCDNCSTSFKICTVCPSNKNRFYTDAQLKKHRYLKSHTNNLKKEETNEKICTFQESSTSIKIPSTIANREALEFLTEKIFNTSSTILKIKGSLFFSQTHISQMILKH